MDSWAMSARRPASPPATESPIASHGKACEQHFNQLCTLLEDAQDQSLYGISLLQVSESSGQFRIWAGNIGALQTNQFATSLDHRLREVPKVSAQVVSLLEDLEEALADIIAIASGERENRVSSPVTFDLDLVDDGDSSGGEIAEDPAELASKPTTEIQELFESIPETIESLFKLSILIRNSGSRDRYSKALAATSKSPFNEQFDIDHVGNKFPRLNRDDMDWLRKRLGKAITQKRQYLRYCREHHEKLSKIPDARDILEKSMAELNISNAFLTVQGQKLEDGSDNKTVISRPASTLAPTTASTVIPTKLEHLEKVEEQSNDGNRSQTSYATSVNDDDSENRLSVMRLEEIAGPAQSFECPYCWTIQRATNQHAWRKHVFHDIKPYLCTSEECDMKLFSDRHTWFTHELQNHLVEWSCCFCSHLPYQTRDKFDKHIRKAHAGKFTDSQLPSLIKACQKPVDQLPASACPFCDVWETRLRESNQHMSPDEILVVTPQQFRHHVGGHMEQLALFAIPRGYKEDGDEDSGGAAPGHGSDSSSDRSIIRVDYEDEDNPRLHIAAFEGLQDEVKALIDENKIDEDTTHFTQDVLYQGGSTWGSALAAAAASGNVDIANLCLPRKPPSGFDGHYNLGLLRQSKIKGWGPLHWAASNGHLPMVEFLILNGISVEEKALDGSTATDLARRHGHDEIVQLLESFHQRLLATQQQTQHSLRIHIVNARDLIKRDIFSLPDPVASVFVNKKMVATTSSIKKSLDPYWKESFDIRVTRDSLIGVNIHDLKKQKHNDQTQGFLGGIAFIVADKISLHTKSSVEVTFDLSARITTELKSVRTAGIKVTGQLIMELSTDPIAPIDPYHKSLLTPRLATPSLSGPRFVVYCHACENEWYPDKSGLVCPRCEGDAIEIVTPENDPRPPKRQATIPDSRDQAL